jgi:hypothetical protein
MHMSPTEIAAIAAITTKKDVCENVDKLEASILVVP